MLPTHCLCTKLRRASRSVTKVYDDALAGIGINATQYSLLKNLQRLGQPSISTLAEALGLDRSTLGRNLKVLEGRGLVLLAGGEDQRNRLVSLSDAGKACVSQALQVWEQAQKHLAERIGSERRALLFELLEDLERLD